ncbi:hypothetical protein GDO81_024334 [Engystomops pustulosus]|uniref:Uncharacterized protein n=1 Tax=Engystomops pustulosus TaxID=76066 RepID=A0AAV6Z5A0_ENGPU|nr:hypothetical protein GDO81_024334 [Engystomops pustulosus]
MSSPPLMLILCVCDSCFLTPGAAGTLGALESKSMPVLGMAAASPFCPLQDPENVAGGSGGGRPMLLTDKRIHTKVSSHSAETLGYAVDGKKSDESW